ncbi:MAG: peptidoglycan-binding protein [Clostridia bacterium]|nr:peptidoglycan-binding protein [Clostridia bacterium]
MDTDTIKEIQHYLRTLSFSDNRLIPLSVDGYYGTQTEDAVKIFQRYYELPISGEVDYPTWKALVDEYATTVPTTIKASFFSHPSAVLNPYDKADLAAFVQIMLTSLSHSYNNFYPLKITGIYGDDTIDQIRRLQSLNDLEPNGIVDIKTWNILTSLYNTRPNASVRS